MGKVTEAGIQVVIIGQENYHCFSMGQIVEKVDGGDKFKELAGDETQFLEFVDYCELKNDHNADIHKRALESPNDVLIGAEIGDWVIAEGVAYKVCEVDLGDEKQPIWLETHGLSKLWDTWREIKDLNPILVKAVK